MSANKARKQAAKPGRRPTKRNFEAAFWTVSMCVTWSGLSHQHLLRLIAAGEIQAIALGPEQQHVLPNGSIRRRTCAKFLVVAEPFKAFVAGLAARGRVTAA